MRLLYTHPNRILVENAKNIVENAGVQIELRNEFAGGAMGELAPISVWLELWVALDRDYERAKTVLESAFNAHSDKDWRCPQCDEINSPAFEFCWCCQSNGPA